MLLCFDLHKLTPDTKVIETGRKAVKSSGGVKFRYLSSCLKA